MLAFASYLKIWSFRAEERSAFHACRTALDETIATCRSFDLEAVLACVRNTEALAHTQAELLGRLSRHCEALSLLVYGHHSTLEAEAYCARHLKTCSSVYLTLLKLYLDADE